MLSSCVTATTLFCCGDLIAQQAVEKKGKNHDVRLLLYKAHPLNNAAAMVACVVANADV